jgi:hypothetical protein
MFIPTFFHLILQIMHTTALFHPSAIIIFFIHISRAKVRLLNSHEILFFFNSQN